MKKLALILSLVIAANTQVLAAKERGGLAAAGSQGAAQEVSSTVNINSADAKELSRVLVGVGAKKAQAIIEYRQKFGPFKSANELTAVKGIGQKTVDKNKSKIKL